MNLVGELKGLSPKEKKGLERLIGRRAGPKDILDRDSAKKAAALSRDISRTIGLIIGRDGRIEFVAVGTKGRVYLPDLGRSRSEAGRLRRLRVVVFTPSESLEWKKQEGSASLLAETLIKNYQVGGSFNSPVIPQDLITDLEKLRLDLVCLIAVGDDGTTKACSLAFLNMEQTLNSRRSYSEVVSHRAWSELDTDVSLFLEDLDNTHEVNTFKNSKQVQKDRAILVGVYKGSMIDAEYSMEELRELARTAGVSVADEFIQRRRELDPRTVIGKGKIEELVLLALDHGADILIFDSELTPSQLRAISQLTELKIIDRSLLILDIFAGRAKSAEGRLQVELAQLKYTLPRLTERDSGLSRLSGGIGGRGPGETKLEVSRRRVRDRITLLEHKIEEVSQQRGLRRSRRQERGVPCVAIVGYTNAGKSTLLNAITKGDTFVENKLFATLDPSSRRMRFPNDAEIIFVDTVGFIRNLPDELIGAFRATLEEVGEADLLLHVVDASQEDIKRHIEVVEDTLLDLDYDEKEKILVLNKCDRLSDIERRALENTVGGLQVSAITREGLSDLISGVLEKLNTYFQGRDPGGVLEYDQDQE